MNAKTVTGAILAGLWWACTAASGQEAAPLAGIGPPPIQRDADGSGPPVDPAVPPAMPGGGVSPTGGGPVDSGLSDFILYRRPECCSVKGPLRPLYTEMYLRTGVSLPVGGQFLSRELQVGWTIEGGVRALFFNAETTSAWVVDVGLVNSNNSGAHTPTPVTLNIFEKNALGVSALTPMTATIRNYNRTFGSLGGGKEWYLWAPANAPGPKWRVGLDAGGRYGTADMTFNEIRHRTDVIAGMYGALHTDFEVPCGCCFLSWGARCEWAYTWGDILQAKSDIQEINVLATFAVRY